MRTGQVDQGHRLYLQSATFKGMSHGKGRADVCRGSHQQADQHYLRQPEKYPCREGEWQPRYSQSLLDVGPREYQRSRLSRLGYCAPALPLSLLFTQVDHDPGRVTPKP